MKKSSLLVLGAFASVLMAKPTVTVSLIPQKYFVEQIAGDTLQINTMVGKGYSPHSYEPKPQQMVQLEKSDLYFAIGMSFEDVWLKKFAQTYPNLKIVLTQDGIEKIAMTEHHHHDEDEHHDEHADHDDHDHEKHAHHDHDDHDEHAHHDHDHEKHAHHDHDDNDEHEHHDHDHEGLDPHIWLDPILVKKQATNITNALVKQYPKNKATYEKNLHAFLDKLDKIDTNIKSQLKSKKGKAFLVYHPSWGYFAKRYGLVQKAIEIQGKEPKPRDLEHIIHEAKEDNIHTIFVQPQFSKKSAEVIAKQINGQVASIDQLAYEWEDELLRTVEVLAQSIK